MALKTGTPYQNGDPRIGMVGISQNSKSGSPHSNLGFIPIWGPTQTLRDANAYLRMGAQRDSERIAKLVDEIRTLTHAAKVVVIAAKSYRSSAKATATVSMGLSMVSEV